MRHLSIRTKLTLLACVSASIALFLAFCGFALNGVHTLREAKIRQLEHRAEVVAFHAVPVITVRDEVGAERLLASLRGDPTIEAVRLYDRRMKVVAHLGAQSKEILQTPMKRRESRFVDFGHVELVEPVVAGGHVLGWIHICANTTDLQGELWEFTRLSTIILVLALVVAIGLSRRFQLAISRPVVALTNASRQITENADYSIRVACRFGGAEFQMLQDAFNGMLDHIQKSDAALQEARDELEDRVEDRTAALSKEIACRTKIQEDLQLAKEAAEAANRAKTEFLANISHEIRTPLNGIIGFADLLLTADDEVDSDEHRSYLHTIHRSGLHLLDLICDVLDLSKIEVGRLDIESISCSPHQVISEVVSVLRSRAEGKGLVLEYRWSTDMPDEIQSDPGRLRQLLINLISNAIKFTERGRIEVVSSITGWERSEPVMQRGAGGSHPEADSSKDATEGGFGPLSVQDGKLRIEVSDTGIGIPEEKFESIFQPFTQADNSVTRRFGGTGLGLAISRRVAEALGGELIVRSEIGVGSRFTAIIHPGSFEGVTRLEPPTSELVLRKPTATRSTKLAGSHILVVDDGDTNRQLIQLILRRAGATVVSVENGHAAVEYASRESYDLILMDVQMPVMDGYTATRTLRSQGVAVPIVALTAHALTGDEEKCREAGCSAYLSKPIDASRLLETLVPILREQPRGSSPSLRQEIVPPLRTPPSRPYTDVQTASATGPIHSTLPLDDDEFRGIVVEFVPRLLKRLGEMQHALETENLASLALLAHWLKGAGGTAGFHLLSQPAKQLEVSSREGSLRDAQTHLQHITDLVVRIEAPS